MFLTGHWHFPLLAPIVDASALLFGASARVLLIISTRYLSNSFSCQVVTRLNSPHLSVPRSLRVEHGFLSETQLLPEALLDRSLGRNSLSPS